MTNRLAEGIAADFQGIGFFGYAYYDSNRDNLRALELDGAAPTLENVQNDSYPAVRSLFLYSSQSVLEEKPEVAAFLSYYLQNLDEVISRCWILPG